MKSSVSKEKVACLRSQWLCKHAIFELCDRLSSRKWKSLRNHANGILLILYNPVQQSPEFVSALHVLVRLHFLTVHVCVPRARQLHAPGRLYFYYCACACLGCSACSCLGCTLSLHMRFSPVLCMLVTRSVRLTHAFLNIFLYICVFCIFLLLM